MLKSQEKVNPAPVVATTETATATPHEPITQTVEALPTGAGSVVTTPTKTAKTSPPFVTVPRWVGLTGIGVVLIALVPRTADWYWYWFFTPVDGKPAWTYWTTAAVGFFVGIVTLISFVSTHLQRDKHFRDAELSKQVQFDKTDAANQDRFVAAELAKQKQFDDAQANALRLATEKQEQERFHFERRELQTEFADIQNRFEKENISIRANAALRLADFAQRIDPAKEPSPTNPARPPRNAANNPYFLSVASQLTTALYLEKDDAVRKAIGDALATMTHFAKVKNAPDEEPQLLYDLMERLKDANAAAKTRFIDAMASWAACEQNGGKLDDSDMPLLTAMTDFCGDSKTTEITLRCLMSEGEERFSANNTPTKLSHYQVQAVVALTRRIGLSDDAARKADDALRLPLLETGAKQLKNSRDALAFALCALPEPVGFPESEIRQATQFVHDLEDTNAAPNWIRGLQMSIHGVRRKELSIPQQFLSGAILTGANLQNIEFFRTFLQGSYFTSANLHGALLRNVMLQGARFPYTLLQNACLVEAHIEDAHFMDTELVSTSFSGVYFTKSDSIWERCTTFSSTFDKNMTRHCLFPTAGLDQKGIERTEQLKAHLQKPFGTPVYFGGEAGSADSAPVAS